jgi:hypothetical protein
MMPQIMNGLTRRWDNQKGSFHVNMQPIFQRLRELISRLEFRSCLIRSN